MPTDRDPYHGSQPVWRTLGARLVFFLSIALLPLGLVAIVQTRDLAREVQEREALTLVALTQRVASGERQVIERAFGAAEAMGTVMELVYPDPDACRSYLQQYINEVESYTFIGLLDSDGRMTCSSFAGPLDFASDPALSLLIDTMEPAVLLEDSPAVSEEPVLIVAVPIEPSASGDGPIFTMLSVPRRAVVEQDDLFEIDRRPLHLLTFNADGEIMTGFDGNVDPAAVLPADRSLEAFVGSRATTFVAMTEAGPERIFSVVPLVPNAYYALGVFDPALAPGLAPAIRLPAGLLPILMWLASLTVVFLAVHRLVIRHIRQLGRDMRRFAQDRRLPAQPGRTGTSGEIYEMEMDFHDMATALLEDEAALENSVREKNVLLKEVYHRVKNNLQLISSIMNMHIRAAGAPETETVLRSLQDRILGLATVHRNLYQSQSLHRTNAADLLREIVGQIELSAGDGVVFETDLEDLQLFPDQAVPLSLLTAELCHQALRSIDRSGARARVRIELQEVEPNLAELAVVRSGPEAEGGQTADIPERLEGQLIRAFAMQLGGRPETDGDGGPKTTRVRFAVAEFSVEPVDF